MKTIIMNNENSKTSEQHRFKLDLTDKRQVRIQHQVRIKQ